MPRLPGALVQLHRAARLLLPSIAVALMVHASRLSAQECDDFDECTVQDACQADGSCVGTAAPNDTPCNLGNICATFTCQQGRCQKVPGTDQNKGAPCDDGDPCTTNDKCFAGGFCFGTSIDNPDPCTVLQADPVSRQCQAVPRCEAELGPCENATCDPNTGNCLDTGSKDDGTACDDGKSCTTNDQCQRGTCRGQLGAGPTQTPSVTATIAAATTTPTPTETPTATATPTVSSTPIETPGCPGDCNHNGQVTVDELITMVNIAADSRLLDKCVPGDVNSDGEIAVDEIVGAVDNALRGCIM